MLLNYTILIFCSLLFDKNTLNKNFVYSFCFPFRFKDNVTLQVTPAWLSKVFYFLIFLQNMGQDNLNFASNSATKK